MDEGATTFLENQTEPDYWSNIGDQDQEDMEGHLNVARAELEQSMMRHHDYYEPGPGGGNASYAKSATMLVTLRSLLGEDAFMEGYHSFIRDWAFKHPSPWDFFNTFERVSGQDLDWFWTSFYYETWTMDQGVESVTADATKTTIVIRDHGFAPMPVRLRITTTADGVIGREIPVTHWFTGAVTAEVSVPSSAGLVTKVEIDPDRGFPDMDRNNNVWEVR
jgi:aminopeptidase N